MSEAESSSTYRRGLLIDSEIRILTDFNTTFKVFSTSKQESEGQLLLFLLKLFLNSYLRMTWYLFSSAWGNAEDPLLWASSVLRDEEVFCWGPRTAHTSCVWEHLTYFPSILSKAHLDDDTDLAEGRHREQNTLPHSPQVRFLEMKENLVPHMSQVTAGGELWSRSELLWS